MVLERKRQVVRLVGASGAFRFTPPLGFRARILAILWNGLSGAAYDQCVVTASVGGDNFWQVNQNMFATTPGVSNLSGCFAVGASSSIPMPIQDNPNPLFNIFFLAKTTSSLPDFYWQDQSVLIAVSLDSGTVNTSSLVYELVPI